MMNNQTTPPESQAGRSVEDELKAQEEWLASNPRILKTEYGNYTQPKHQYLAAWLSVHLDISLPAADRFLADRQNGGVTRAFARMNKTGGGIISLVEEEGRFGPRE